MNETEFKKKFKDSVRQSGGFAASLTGSTIGGGGLPDMYVIVPGFNPMLIEAKFIKDVGEKFTRKIDYSPLQKQFMLEANKVHNHATYGLVGLRKNNKTYAVIVPHNIEKITHDMLGLTCTSWCGKGQKYFDVKTMFLYRNAAKYLDPFEQFMKFEAT